MTDTFREICWGIIHGFRDAVLGTVHVFKLDADRKKKIKQPEEPLTTLAKRRAEKQKRNQKEKEKAKESEPRVLNRIFLCCAWNGGVFWMSILLFNGLILPGLQWLTAAMAGRTGTGIVWEWIGPMLSWTFSALWILPLFVLSKIVNCFWFQDIADMAYRKSRGRPQLPNISLFIADMLFSILTQVFFLLQGTAASFLPIPAVGQCVSILHMCLLYSLYSFEYKWINMGWELHRRLSHIEQSWPYFCGFGLPMALLTALPSSFVVSGCVFSILFPLSIISANEADDMRRKFQYPLKLFAPVVSLTDLVFHHSLTKHQKQPVRTKPPVKQTQFQDETSYR